MEAPSLIISPSRSCRVLRACNASSQRLFQSREVTSAPPATSVPTRKKLEPYPDTKNLWQTTSVSIGGGLSACVLRCVAFEGRPLRECANQPCFSFKWAVIFFSERQTKRQLFRSKLQSRPSL